MFKSTGLFMSVGGLFAGFQIIGEAPTSQNDSIVAAQIVNDLG